MRYPIAIEPGTDATAWGVVVPDLPGCFSAGGTLEETMLDDTLERVNISLPRRVLHRLDAQARSAGETRSGFIARMAVEGREPVAHT